MQHCGKGASVREAGGPGEQAIEVPSFYVGSHCQGCEGNETPSWLFDPIESHEFDCT